MPGTPFREILTLSDAVELVGRRLFAETWSGLEYTSRPRKSPDEISSERKPLEERLAATEAEFREAEAAIARSIDAAENRRLATHRDKLESRAGQLRTTLSLDHPLNDIVADAYNTHVRWKAAKETLWEALRAFKLKAHDGRGQELNQSAWSSPKFRCYLELSIVVNPKTAGAPRWQAVRIDRDKFDNWLAILTPLVEVKHELSAEERLTEFLRREVAAADGGTRKTKDTLRKEALAQIAGTKDRMFDRVWSNIVPKHWRKAGAPRKANRSR